MCRRRPKKSYLWLLSLGVFLPLATFAQNPATPAVPPAPPAPAAAPAAAPAQAQIETLDVADLTPEERDEILNRRNARTTSGRNQRAQATVANFDKLSDDQLKKLNELHARDEANRARQNQEQDDLRNNKSSVAREVTKWSDLAKLFPSIDDAEAPPFMVFDNDEDSEKPSSPKTVTGPDAKKFTKAVYLDAIIPTACLSKIDGGKFLSIKELDEGRFVGYRFRSSDAAEDCVRKFWEARNAGKAAGRCEGDGTVGRGEDRPVACTSLATATRLENLKKNPRVGFYACGANEKTCTPRFYNNGETDRAAVKRVADSEVLKKVLERKRKGQAAREDNLSLAKLKADCYKDDFNRLVREVERLQRKMPKENFNAFIKGGLDHKLAALAQEAEAAELSAFPGIAEKVAAFYKEYLDGKFKDMDLDLLQGKALELFHYMMRKTLEDPGALDHADSTGRDAKAIANAALSAPLKKENRIYFQNQVAKNGGVDAEVVGLKYQRKVIIAKQLEANCKAGKGTQQQCLIALPQMLVSLEKERVAAFKFFDRAYKDTARACASENRTSARKGRDPFDDYGVALARATSTEFGEEDDRPSAVSRCKAMEKNLERLALYAQDANDTAQRTTGGNTAAQQAIANTIWPGHTQLPNATVDNNAALRFITDPKNAPGFFTPQQLAQLTQATAPICLSGAGCPAGTNTVTPQQMALGQPNTSLAPPLPVIRPNG